jgi:hypothetical protein
MLARKTALSSVLVRDCEAYKDFLADPIPSFIGPVTSVLALRSTQLFYLRLVLIGKTQRSGQLS